MLLADAARELGIRLIGLDRPGRAKSDPQLNRKLLDWPDDVAQAADLLGIPRFAVIGLSGGGPHALACAYKIPERLTACGIVSGAGPYHLLDSSVPLRFRATYELARRMPVVYRPFFWTLHFLRGSQASADRQLRFFADVMPAPDRAILRDPIWRGRLATAVYEGARRGPWGTYQDGAIITGDWGFAPEQIAFDKILLWHGLSDFIVPASVGRQVARALPHCDAYFFPNEGHFSLCINHALEILSALKNRSAVSA